MTAARLPKLEAALKRRYPGVIVVAKICANDWSPSYQCLQFFGSCAALLAYGLATESGDGDLQYEDGLGTKGFGYVGEHNNACIIHSIAVKDETATPKRPRKFPTKKLQADVRQLCKRLALESRS